MGPQRKYFDVVVRYQASVCFVSRRPEVKLLPTGARHRLRFVVTACAEVLRVSTIFTEETGEAGLDLPTVEAYYIDLGRRCSEPHSWIEAEPACSG